MPTDWVTVSGVLGNLTGSVDVGYSYAPYAKYAGDGAADILKQVDKVLRSANTVLENHREFIPANEFQDLKRTYCRYHWQMTNEAQEDRATTDRLIRQSRILSQLYAKREPHAQRARNLLNQVETFQTRVLSASRSAQPPDTLMLFDDEIAEQAAVQQPTQAEATPSNQSYTSWFSVFGRAHAAESTSTTGMSCHIIFVPPIGSRDPMLLESESTKVESESPLSVAEGHGFVISVTHFPKSKSESTGDDTTIGTGNNIYRRMISFENAEKRVEIIDPKLYALDSNETYIPEDALRAMSELGQRLLSQSDSDVPTGSHVVSDLTTGSSLETTVQNFKKMSMNVVRKET